MSNLEKILRDVGYFGVGAAAAVVEAGGKVVKALVNKGEKTLRDNQDTVDEIKRKAKEFGEKVKDTVEKAARSEDEHEAAEAEAQPAEPDAFYHTDEPVPEEEVSNEEAPIEEAPAEEAPIDDVPAEPAPEAAAVPVMECTEPAADAAATVRYTTAVPTENIPVLEIPDEDDPKEFFNRC